jgi:hypothetical protein
MKEWTEIYKGHRLICTPLLLADGRYSARLFVQIDSELEAETEEIKININPSAFNTEEEAANAARIIGRRWVEDNA